MTHPRPIDDPIVRRAQARSGNTRRAVLDRLAVAPAGVAVLAAALAVHPNAVRQHLAVLHAAGLVIEEIDHGTARVGRPGTVYRAVADGAVTPNPFERLAALLVDVAAGGDPMEVGTAEGVARAVA